jgi:16S rRNA (uracil1498-N3)-methyltransferase
MFHNFFYIAPQKISKSEIIIDDEEFHHIRNVLRKKPNDFIYLTDGNGFSYQTRIVQITKSQIKAKILKRQFHKKENIVDISLAFTPLKGSRNDFILEKATELGVVEFLPFISKFTVVSRLSPTKLKRFDKVTKSAVLQSRHYYMPKIRCQKDLNSLVGRFEKFDTVIVANKNGLSTTPLNSRSILYIIGPEGGFEDSEIKFFQSKGARLLSLGMNRLRSETAAIVGIVKILTVYGDI